MIIKQFIYGLLAIGVGVITLKYNYQIVNNTTRLEFFETKLGPGSTYLVYKVGSLLLVLSGMLYMTGFGDDVARAILNPLVRLFPKI